MWMQRHLEVAVHPFANRDALASLEMMVLNALDPPLNLSGCTVTPLRSELSRHRLTLAGTVPSSTPSVETGRSQAPVRSTAHKKAAMSQSKVTLHEEIAAILREHGDWMSTQEIADAVNTRGNYSKKDELCYDRIPGSWTHEQVRPSLRARWRSRAAPSGLSNSAVAARLDRLQAEPRHQDDPFHAWSLELHGHEVIYRTAGSGPPVVIVHGMVNSSKHWRDVALRLAENHTVIVPDLIGHGDSAAVRGDYSIGAHAAVIRDLLSAIGVESATFVGHSLGGGIAMQFFYQFPYKVERLALVSSGGLGQDVSPMLRGAALPGAAGFVWAASHRSVLGALDRIAAAGRKAGWRKAVYLSAVTRALRPLQDPGADRRSLITSRGDRHPRSEGLGCRPSLSTGTGRDAHRLGREGPHDSDPARHRRSRLDPALADGDSSPRRALPEPRGPSRPGRCPRPLARRDEAVRPLRRGLVRAHRLEARPRPAPSRGLASAGRGRFSITWESGIDTAWGFKSDCVDGDTRILRHCWFS